MLDFLNKSKRANLTVLGVLSLNGIAYLTVGASPEAVATLGTIGLALAGLVSAYVGSDGYRKSEPSPKDPDAP